jgi:hypothetical protein
MIVNVAIVLNDKVLKVVQVAGRNRDEISDRAFAWADQVFGHNKGYELAMLDEPRTWVLFHVELVNYQALNPFLNVELNKHA